MGIACGKEDQQGVSANPPPAIDSPAQPRTSQVEEGSETTPNDDVTAETVESPNTAAC